jgi:hypothetical protein
MRLLPILVLVAVLCGCIQAAEKKDAVEVPPTVYFTEDFSAGLGNWSVKSSGGGSMEVATRPNLRVDRALQMRSPMMRSVYAQAPDFRMDWGGDYVVSFDFMLEHRENFGYTVYKDRNVELVLEQATGLACVEDGKRILLGRFDTNQWQRVTVKAHPGLGEYDVYLGKESKKSCNLWKSEVETFIVGDTDPSDVVYGDGVWDNFRITDRQL